MSERELPAPSSKAAEDGAQSPSEPQPAEGRPIVPEYTSLVFIDTETTGLHPTCGHRPWEFAGIKWSWKTKSNHRARGVPNGVHRTMLILQIEPEPSWNWDQRAREIGGYDQPGRLNPIYKQNAIGAADFIADWLEDATLVGNNVGFDSAMLEALCIDHGVQPSWKYRKYEITSLIAGQLHTADRSFPSVPVDRTRYMSKEPVGDRHTALGDALWVEQSFIEWLDFNDLPDPAVD